MMNLTLTLSLTLTIKRKGKTRVGHSIPLSNLDLPAESLYRNFKDYRGITPALAYLAFSAPFRPFLHRWEAWKYEVTNETDEASREHLKVL